MKLKVYIYKNCDTCRKAGKYLDNNGIKFESIPIREEPPSVKELNMMLNIYKGDVRKLFNTSGVDYRSLNLKEKLPKMSIDKAIDLLSSNGNLVKRPFVIKGTKGVVGFNESVWKNLFL